MNYFDREKQIVEEALNRGASARFLTLWLLWKRRQGGPSSQPSEGEIAKMIEPEVIAYRNKLSAEFNSLGKIGFADPDKKRTNIEHYFVMRPLYYLLGFSNPCQDIFFKNRTIYLPVIPRWGCPQNFHCRIE
jgi:hypothetical protein